MNKSEFDSPWKGIESYNFSDRDKFYGRSEETDNLIKITTERKYTILYGLSGVGKSSLLNAGLYPGLKTKNNFVVNVNMRLIDFHNSKSITNQIIKIIKDSAEKEQIEITPLNDFNIDDVVNNSLWYFFHTNEFWSKDNQYLTPIIIIDQFEDIFKEEISLSVTEDFFKEIDELSSGVPPIHLREKLILFEEFKYNQSSSFHFLFSLREDYLPRLDDYIFSIQIFELTKSRYSIKLLDKNQAKEIILRPVKGLVKDEVADKIISILSSSTYNYNLNEKIEPFLLSLFMFRVHKEMLKRNMNEITVDLINKIGSDVVNDYYLESMKKVSSRAVRLLENVLLTPKGNRDSISFDKLIESDKINKNEIDTLLKARIIKKNTVNGVDRIEFTHDIISKYAKKNREKRENNNKYQLYIGFIGSISIIVLAFGIGVIMERGLTYTCIPLLTIFSSLSGTALYNIKITNKKKLLFFLIFFMIIGILIDLTQIVAGIGYILYPIMAITTYIFLSSFNFKLSQSKPSNILYKFAYVFTIMIFTVFIVPTLCFGYNIFIGLDYSRGRYFGDQEAKIFYIKNYNGDYGLRNREKILLNPVYGSEITKTSNTEYITTLDGKFGMLDSTFKIIVPFEFDSVSYRNENPYFYTAGKEYVNNGLNIKWAKDLSNEEKDVIRMIVENMLPIKGGDFDMGTDIAEIRKRIPYYSPLFNEDKIHKVIISDFFMNKYEVTLKDWITIMGYDPRSNDNFQISDTISNLNIPVYKISYDQANKFIDKLNGLTGLSFSLPSEAQWEFAAKGGLNKDKYDFSGSNSEFDVGWVNKNAINILHPVGTKKPNSLGLYDMTGNVSEFCRDIMSTSFYETTNNLKDPVNLDREGKGLLKYIVLRGGSIESYDPEQLTVSKRYRGREDLRFRSVGFRLALNN